METSRRVDEGLGSQSGANGRGARETVRGKWTGGIWWRITSLFPSSLPPAFIIIIAYTVSVPLMPLQTLPVTGACSYVENNLRVPVTRPCWEGQTCYRRQIRVSNCSCKDARYIGTRGKELQIIDFHLCI